MSPVLAHACARARVRVERSLADASRTSCCAAFVGAGLLFTVDSLSIMSAVTTTLQKGPSMLLLFMFEYIILLIAVVKT